MERRILVIDDEENIVSSYRELLTCHHFAVTACSESSQALPLLRAETFDIVLLDIRMPGIEGTDLLPMMKRLRPDLPVILVSAYCDPKDAKHYQSLGAFESLGKPFSHEALVDAIGRALDHQERIPVELRSLSLRQGRDQVYRKLILAALTKTNWNQVKASELLGVSRFCLMRWMKKLGVAV
ncbi:MAG: response regulator [Candidatus Omnitrophica bacterium]|nr:response regulator [Candidatus Omnitrophota bacterium]